MESAFARYEGISVCWIEKCTFISGIVAMAQEGQEPTHAPDTAPEPACPRRPEPTDRNWMGRPSPECRSRLTFDRSPVRKSRTPGSARGAGGKLPSLPRQTGRADLC